jgi:hypothetical protein
MPIFNGLSNGLMNEGCDHMEVGFKTFWTTCAISTYHHYGYELDSSLWRGVLDTTCDKFCQWLAADLGFSPGTPVSSTNNTDCHNIAENYWKWH